MGYSTTAENSPYKTPKRPGRGSEAEINARPVGASQRASYTPNGGPSVAERHGYGKSGGRANAQGDTVPSVVVGGSSVAQAPPAMPGTLRIGDNKNVSTPVSG